MSYGLRNDQEERKAEPGGCTLMASRAESIRGGASVSLKDTLVDAGLAPELAGLLEKMPHRTVQVDARRPFREPGVPRNEVMFVRSGILSKYKADGSGRRQIVALRFPGEGILPREGVAGYGIQAIVRSEVLVGKAEDFDPIVEANPELARFFWRLVQRNEAIGYEWLVNCGRRDSTARVAHLLCETATRSGIDVDQEPLHNPFTQQQIADITGQTSVNVNRVFADLERQGLIRREGRSIFFDDWPEIRRVASFQPAYLE
jgi:CRP-like cAMP-binding protein